MRRLTGVVITAVCSAALATPGRLELVEPQPEAVVRQFYTFLLSADTPGKGPPLFTKPSVFLTGRMQGDGKAEIAQLWEWLRARKPAFSFWCLTSADEFHSLGLQRVLRVSPGEAPAFVGVTVFATLFPRGRDGIYKQVFFPLESRDGRFLINPSGITVNGIMLDPAGEYRRQDALYESLGMR